MYDKLIIKTKQAVYALPLESIIYMEKDLRKIRVHTRDENIEFYGKFTDIVCMLDERFMFCHRSYLINMDEIVVMTANEIYVSNNVKISFGRNTYCRAKRTFNEYLVNKKRKNALLNGSAQVDGNCQSSESKATEETT